MASGGKRERAVGRRLGRLSGPPLIVQFILLVVGALIAAQLATLLLTLILPPAPPRDYALADIAAALRGADDGARRFDRREQSGPPDFSSHGWFVSPAARSTLAGLLRLPVDEVALGFYTQLPVGGTVDAVSAPDRLPADAERPRQRIGATIPAPAAGSSIELAGYDPSALSRATGSIAAPGNIRLLRAALVQQMPGGPPGGGFPGGGPPGGGFPGGGLPGGGFPQSLPQPSPPQSRAPPLSATLPPVLPAGQIAPSAAAGIAPQTQPQPPSTVPAPAPASATPPMGITRPPMPGALAPGMLTRPAATAATPPPPPPPPTRATPRPDVAPSATDLVASRPTEAPSPSPAAVVDTPLERPAAAPALPGGIATAPSPGSLPQPLGRPVPIALPAANWLGLARSPFVEGDFVAGMRLADGRWMVVSPRAEGFPNAWQRRVALWFLLSLLAVAPVAWLLARRIVGPLNAFARAADVLGRDPGAAILPLAGPAEIGRAAYAFNQMQSRLRSFVDDRTAMIGAISHDLRTPLTRLRFRIEDIPESQQDALRNEVGEMEDMISSVIAFMRDASTPHARERRDLAEIVDDVIEDASVLGNVRAGEVESAIVDVDPLGIRRVLNNLLTNAMKYGGGRTSVALRVENSCAVADVVDDGPGVPDAELERIFEPFYRSEAAKASGREGSGLGLAVCRSIARAHGGDVALFRSPEGFTARITLPLAFTDDRRVA